MPPRGFRNHVIWSCMTDYDGETQALPCSSTCFTTTYCYSSPTAGGRGCVKGSRRGREQKLAFFLYYMNRQSSIVNRQSSIVNRQSSIVNRQSLFTLHFSFFTPFNGHPQSTPSPSPLHHADNNPSPAIVQLTQVLHASS